MGATVAAFEAAIEVAMSDRNRPRLSVRLESHGTYLFPSPNTQGFEGSASFSVECEVH